MNTIKSMPWWGWILIGAWTLAVFLPASNTKAEKENFFQQYAQEFTTDSGVECVGARWDGLSITCNWAKANAEQSVKAVSGQINSLLKFIPKEKQ